MDSASKRPWYRLHWVTWVVMTIVIASLVCRELLPQRSDGGWASTDQGHIELDELIFGWPFIHVIEYSFGVGTFSSFSSDWHHASLTINVVVCFVLALCTAVVVEARLGCTSFWQFSIRSLMILIATVGILLGLIVRREELSLPIPLGGRPTDLVSWDDFANPLRWPVLFALACTIYCLGWLALSLLRWVYASVIRR